MKKANIPYTEMEKLLIAHGHFIELQEKSPELEISEIRSNMLVILDALDISEKLFTSHAKNGTLTAKKNRMKRNDGESTHELIKSNILEARAIQQSKNKRKQIEASLNALRVNWLKENGYSADRKPLKRTEKVVNFYISNKVKASLEKHARDFFEQGQIIQNFTQAQALLEGVINRESNAELSTEEITYFYSYFNKLKNENLLTNKK